MNQNPNVVFGPDTVLALLGGTFPETNGFRWESVERFELEVDVLQPYAGEDILPGPGLQITITALVPKGATT